MDRRVVKGLAALVSMAIAPWVLGATPASESEPPLHLRASINTAGPYGQSWYLRLAPDGEVALQVFYSTNPSGNLMARFNLPADRVAAIRRILQNEGFFALSEQIAPDALQLHMPDLQLEVWIGDDHRKIRLYDPKQVQRIAEKAAAAKKFFAVWSCVFEGLPLKPEW